MWGGEYEYKKIWLQGELLSEGFECDWSGGKRGAGEFDKCPDLKEYDDGQDCDPACTLTGGSKSSKNGKCVWTNIN